jgi:hypothetical protein
MILKTSEKANRNYLAKIIRIDNLRKHPNADRMQITTIDGNNVITGLDASEGMLYVYFPLECAINKEYLSFSNSFEDKTLNLDTEVKGYFHSTGRVRATRLRSEKSEGYIVPVHNITEWILSCSGESVEITEADINKEFDLICDLEICRKYIVKYVREQSQQKNQTKKSKVSRLVDEQFHFHIDTPQLKKFIGDVNPEAYISITRKLHGTSAVISKILCVKTLNWFERLLKTLGVNIVDTHYDLVYSSRKVVKNGFMDVELFLRILSLPGNNIPETYENVVNLIEDFKKYGIKLQPEVVQNHFYITEVWGDCAKKIEPYLKNGISLYGEIVGYQKDGAEIQKGYDYKCKPNTFEFYAYRATYTSVDGDVYEMSPRELKTYCDRYGIKTVPEVYYGKAKDLYDLPTDNHWHENFLQKLCDEHLEKDCDLCDNKVPDEGICLRVDKPLDIEIYKLKSFAFLQMETKANDKGIVDIETMESEEVSENE